MFRKNCALALSMLLMLSSLFPASVYANTVDEGGRSVLTVSEEEEKLVEDHQDAQEKDVSEVETTVEKVAFHEERILELAVFHLDEVEAEAEKLADIEIKHDEETVEVTAEHFSVFVVSFINKADKGVKSVGMIADNSLMLKDLFGEDNPFNGDFSEVQAVSSDHEDIVSVSKNDDGEVLLKALKEGEAMINVTSKYGDVKNFRIIVQKPYDQGRIGQNMTYIVSGEEGKMTLTIKGYGWADYRERAPWFPYKDQIQKVVIEENIEVLNIENIFAEMKNLEEVSLPNTLVDIPFQAFYHSDKLKDVTIPASVQEIGSQAFLKESGSGVKNTIQNLSSYFLKDGDDYKSQFTNVVQAQTLNEENSKVSIASLSLYSLPGINNFLEIKYSNVFGFIPHFYLYKTKDLTKVPSIDDFKDSHGNFQNELVGGNWRGHSVNNVYSRFKYCTINENDWEDGATYNCHILATRENVNQAVVSDIFTAKIKVGDPKNILPEQEGKLTWKISFEGNDPVSHRPVYKLRINGSGEISDSTLPNGLRPWNKVFYALRNNPEVKLELSDGITRLGKEAFRGINILSGDLVLPDSIREIADSAFYYVPFEGKIKFPAQLKTIGNSAFENAIYTSDLKLPEGLQSIGENAFRGNNIGNITIPTTVRKIGLYAFYKDEMGLDGKNIITNNSNIKLSDRYANRLFTTFKWDDSAEAGIIPPRRSGGGGGSSSGGSGGGSSMKVSTGNNNGSSAPVNWQKDDKGWWVRNNDGSYPKNEWKQINNNWYFFNGEGYMATGWVAINDAWYYMDTAEGSNNGIMSTGWKLLNDTWYFLSQEAGANNGKMLAGWQLINGKWYYFSTEAGANYGKMLANTVVDGYTLGADGAWNMQPKKTA